VVDEQERAGSPGPVLPAVVKPFEHEPVGQFVQRYLVVPG
jgi:hypothetical protein